LSSKVKASINAHDDDVNSVCYVDKQDSNLVLTASDDGICKLWDTRTKSNEAAGNFQGHICGIAHIESRGDNRYFLSNSKDQSIKVWDLRKSHPKPIKTKDYGFFSFDYRNSYMKREIVDTIKSKQQKNDKDNSVMTFWGHETYVKKFKSKWSYILLTNNCIKHEI